MPLVLRSVNALRRGRIRSGRGRTATVGLVAVALLSSTLTGVSAADSSTDPQPRFAPVRLDQNCDPACTSATLAQPNTSRKIAVASDGTILAAFRATEGVFVTRSTDRGATFDPPVRVSSASAQPSLAVSASGRAYVAWVQSGTAYLSRGSRANTWSAPIAMGAINSQQVQLAVDGDHVYVVNQQGTTLIRSTDGGETFSTTTVSDRSWAYSDVHVDPLTNDVYVITDDPSVSYYRSTDRGASFSAATSVSAVVYYSVGALTSTPEGALAYFAGMEGNLERINLTDGSVQRSSVQATDLQTRSLGADAFGNVVSGNISGAQQLQFQVSTDLGQTFSDPVTLGPGVRANAAIDTTNGDVLFLHETSSGVYMAVYGGLLSGYGVTVDLSAVSFDPSGQPRTITVTNTTDEEQPVTFIGVGDDDPFEVTHTCGEVVPAQESCTVTITPTGAGGGGVLTVHIGDVERSVPLSSTQVESEDEELPTPTTGDLQRTVDGFTVQIDNHDPETTYHVASDHGTATVDQDGQITVTGLTPGTSATVTITATKPGAADTTTTVTGTALDRQDQPTHGEPTRTPDGFTVQIDNHDPETTYHVASDHGTATVDQDGQITVTGLTPGTSATVTITATKPGAADTTATVTGTALTRLETMPDTPKDPVPTAGGTRLPSVASGTGSAIVDGAAVDARTSHGSGGFSVTAGGVRVDLASSGILPSGSGAYLLSASSPIDVRLAGLEPGSTAHVWLLTGPSLLGTTTIGEDGKVELSGLELPGSITACSHTIQVVGLSTAGEIVALQLGVTLVPSPYPFGDVGISSPHAANVACAEAHGIVRGFGDGTFAPAGGLQRAQFASMLARMLDLDTSSTATRFPDVDGSVHAGAIAAIEDAGLVHGFDDGRFRPNQVITRGQVASILAAVAEVTPKADGPFRDVRGSIHAGAINALVETGVVQGFDDGTFGPQQPVQRAQAASLLVRYLGL